MFLTDIYHSDDRSILLKIFKDYLGGIRIYSSRDENTFPIKTEEIRETNTL